LKTKNIPATQQKPSPVNNYGDWGDGEAMTLAHDVGEAHRRSLFDIQIRRRAPAIF
jgi:hypothetical protein